MAIHAPPEARPAAPARRPLRLLTLLLVIATLAAGLLPARPALATATVVSIPCPEGAGDVAALAAAIHTANRNGRDDVIELAPGCIFTFTAPHNTTGGPNALPVVRFDGGRTLTIKGNGAVFRRAEGAPAFRFLHNEGTLTIEGLTLTGGRAEGGNGGAILNTCVLTIRDSTFAANAAVYREGYSGEGGAIYSLLTLIVERSTFTDHRALFGGAILAGSGSSASISNSTISGNSADVQAAAIAAHGAHLTLASSTVADNRVTGDGYHPADGYDYGVGGALYATAGRATYTAAIVAANAPADCAGDGDLVSGGFNLLGAAGTCPDDGETDRRAADPGLLPLADNGGPTQTRALAPDSPALDLVPVGERCPATDQRGIERPQGLACDAGAYERIVELVAAPSVDTVFEGLSASTIDGSFTGAPGATYSITIYAADACGEAGPSVAEFVVERFNQLAGTGATPFSRTLPLPAGRLAGKWITAEATSADGFTSPRSACAPVRTNEFWASAFDLALAPVSGQPGVAGATLSQYIAHTYQERWYRLPVAAGSTVRVTLVGQPGGGITLHRDLQTVYDDLLSPPSAEEVAASELPSSFLPSSFLPSSFLPSSFLPSSFLPSSFLPSGFLPSGFLPSGFLPSGFLPSGFLPSSFLPSSFLPSSFLPSSFLPEVYAGAVRESLIAFGYDPYNPELTIERNAWDLAENFYIRVTGPADPAGFTLRVEYIAGSCDAIAAPSGPVFAGDIPPPAGSRDSLLLWDSARFAASDPSADLAALRAELASFAARPEIDGVLIDLAEATAGGDPRYPRVAAARAQALANPTCVAATNLWASEIKAVIAGFRAANTIAPDTTSVRYLTIVGGDEVVPFYRYPDLSGLGVESEFFPPVQENSRANAALRFGTVKSQVFYGAEAGVWQGNYERPLPDIAVGRLVGGAAGVRAMLDAYGAVDGRVTPGSALVTGYDFVADAAEAVRQELEAGLDGVAPDTLIQPQGFGPNDPNAWTASQLRARLLNQRNDLVFFTGHFSPGSALAADYRTTLLAQDLLAAPAGTFTNAVLFGLGCHSGYNVPAPDAIAGLSPDPDFPETFNRSGASFVAATGFAYGDTELIDHGERYLLNLARALRAADRVALGQAMNAAYLDFLAQKPALSGIDEKTLLQFTLYGHPQLLVDLPGAPTTAGSTPEVAGVSPAGGPGAALGLRSGELTVTPSLTRVDRTLSTVGGGTVQTTYFRGGDGWVANPAEPILPLERADVTVPGAILRGALFRGGEYADLPGITPGTAATTTEQSRPRPSFLSEFFYPPTLASANVFDTFQGGPQQLLVTPAQFQSSTPGSLDGVLRTYSSLRFQLFYLPDGWTDDEAVRDRALAPAPEITGVAQQRQGNGNVAISAFVIDKASVGVQEVVVAYTRPGSGRWESANLERDGADPTLWRTAPAGLSLPDGSRYFVQAVNAAGRVGLGFLNGDSYRVEPPAPPVPSVPATMVAVSVPARGTYDSTVTVKVRITADPQASAANRFVRLSLGGLVVFDTTDSTGLAEFRLRLALPPGRYRLQAAFTGEPGLLPARFGQDFAIERAATVLICAPGHPITVLRGADIDISATLKTAGPRGVPIPDRTVIFIGERAEGGRFAAVGKTNLDGQALLGRVGWPAGTYTVRAYFGQPALTLPDGSSASFADALYLPSQSDVSSLKLVEPTAGAIYRARQVGARVWIERNVAAAGLGDYDGSPKDGWALVGRTNGTTDNGTLRAFSVRDGVPYAVIFTQSSRHPGRRCIVVTPTSLDVVLVSQQRLVRIVQDPVPCP